MKKHLILTLVLALLRGIGVAQSVTGPLGEKFSVRLVASKLSDPWEICYGTFMNVNMVLFLTMK